MLLGYGAEIVYIEEAKGKFEFARETDTGTKIKDYGKCHRTSDLVSCICSSDSYWETRHANNRCGIRNNWACSMAGGGILCGHADVTAVKPGITG